MVAPPTTQAQLSHAMTLRLGGNTVGALNEWNPKINRTLTDLFEFGQVTGKYAPGANSGGPFEVVPGNVSGMQIDLRRWDLYTEQIETALTNGGNPPTANAVDVTMLNDQTDAIDNIREVFLSPGNINNIFRLYKGLWWQDTGRTLDAKGDRTINAGGTLRYTRRDKGRGLS